MIPCCNGMAGELGASVHGEPDRIIIEAGRRPGGPVTLNCTSQGWLAYVCPCSRTDNRRCDFHR
jgi:hypothetical protein